MRILARESALTEVLIYLSWAEAAELRDAAEAVLLHFDDPGYHAYVSSADYQVEMTLAPDAPSA